MEETRKNRLVSIAEANRVARSMDPLLKEVEEKMRALNITGKSSAQDFDQWREFDGIRKAIREFQGQVDGLGANTFVELRPINLFKPTAPPLLPDPSDYAELFFQPEWLTLVVLVLEWKAALRELRAYSLTSIDQENDKHIDDLWDEQADKWEAVASHLQAMCYVHPPLVELEDLLNARVD